MASDRANLLRDLRRQGCEVTVTNGGHLRIRTPDGGPTIFAAALRNRRGVRV